MMDSDKRVIQSVKKTEQVEWLLKTVLRLPTIWLIISSIFVLFSMFNISWVPAKGLFFTFQVTNTTAIFFALIWLPALLSIFALVGGGIKTPAGEISSAGFGDLIQFLESDTLGVIIDDTTQSGTAEDVTEERKIQQEFLEAYSARIPPGKATDELFDLAERYNKLREEMPAGSERTLQMRSLGGRMRALVTRAGLVEKDITDLLISNDGGKRLIGLSALRVNGNTDFFEQIVHIIDNSLSAYEQFQALVVTLNMVERLRLSDTQKKRLEEVLVRQRDYDAEKKQWIHPSSNGRGKLSAQILSSMR